MWLSHLQHDWQSPVWRHFLDELGEVATVVRYDERGFGLSELDLDDFSLDRRVADLETLVEATGLDRFAVLGMSGGAPVGLAYAVTHPERVTRMVLYCGMAGEGLAQEDQAAEEVLLAMIRAGWARPDPLFRRLFTTAFIPDATEEQMQWIDELQHMSTNTENAVRSRIARGQIDLTGLLPSVGVPTLVLHALGDRMAPGWAPAGGRVGYASARMSAGLSGPLPWSHRDGASVNDEGESDVEQGSHQPGHRPGRPREGYDRVPGGTRRCRAGPLDPDVPHQGGRPPAQPGVAVGTACEGCPPLPELLARYAAAGGRYLVCPICFNAKALDPENLLENAELGGTIPMWQWIGDEGATSFSY